MGVKLVSASGGSVEINPPATASNYTATMPAGSGTVSVNGVSSNIVSGTAQNSTSGTSIDFTGIPSWVKRITVMFSGLSTSGTSVPLLQIGSGSITATGYLGSGANVSNGSTGAANFTTGFGFNSGHAAASVYSGIGVLDLTNSATNLWVFSMTGGYTNTTGIILSGGNIALSGTLDRVRITTVNGTDAFDAGTINIMYE